MASTKQEIWLNEYLECWNATEAARRAGYKWPNKSGPANLQTLEDEIKQRVSEKAMTADELLIRLGEKARFDFSPFVKGYRVDVEAVKAAGFGHMIRRVYRTEHDDRVEFTNPDEAQMLLAKIHGLTDKGPAGTEADPVHQVTMTLEEWQTRAEKQKKQAEKALDLFDSNEEMD